MDKNQDTHFGYKTVKAADKADLVANVFHSVANRYDLMNDLMSLGIHRLWKRYAIELASVREGQTILDLAAGTGDLAKLMAPKVGKSGKIILSDINDSMLMVGRDRMTDSGFIGNIEYVQANAESLPFKDKQFDCVTLAFGLRNVTDKDAALRSIYRVLKPGGRLLVLEFSKPTHSLLEKVYDEYSFKILPKIGSLVTDDEESYKYLAESIRMHPDQQTLKSMFLDAGFEQCDVHNLTGGVVALHRGFRF
ncbi:MAG: bifunctional demethylmenaquinone methyltransferase/2-methoxy-6-polyprenyl-1,4-benzoquinol methylase UbiE [Gammaproteobacteria bacterium]|nr:bifunctional demethylmenaquinone methyltransferase/2-methoxy-6-polyprenyl-1,4-benzoquinol methylase UbiE [Gammaproteobacteria bacterium]